MKMSLCFSHFLDQISLCLEVKRQISGYCKLIFYLKAVAPINFSTFLLWMTA